jgi:hypothetical protein
MDAIGKDTATERASALGDLLGEVRGTLREPFVLLNAARCQREAGDDAELPADKTRFYEESLRLVNDFSARYSDNLMARLPWRPALQPGQTPLPLPARLKEYCATQIEWLKAHPTNTSAATDAGLSAAMVLSDPDGKKHNLEIRFYSAEAPQCVHNFLELARSGYFSGRLVYAQERETLESTAGRGVFLGSAMAKVAPDKPELWGGANEDVGFTLPKENNGLKPKRGRLLMEKFYDNGTFVGLSPVTVLLATSDIARTDDRVVFAEVQGSAELLTLLEGALAKKDPQGHIDHCAVHVLEKPWTIDSVAVTGDAANKPEVAVLRSMRDPVKPEEKK